MDAAIRSRRYPSVRTVRDRFEVSERTVYEDVQFLKHRLGAPLKFDRGRGGYFYTDAAWMLPTFLATDGQILALVLSIELAQRYLGTTFEEPLRNAIEHLMGALPGKTHISLGELASHYTIRSGATAGAAPDVLLALHDAIERKHPVRITYFTAARGEETTRVVHPYQLVNARGEWHLVAYDLLREGVRQFALQRIREWRVLSDEHFAVAADFSAAHYFAESFQSEHGSEVVQVTVRFDAYQARYIRERQWHPTQHIEELSDGGLILRFTTGALGEVRRWIMGYGCHAQVLAPEEFARSIGAELLESARMYESSPETASIPQ